VGIFDTRMGNNGAVAQVESVESVRK